MLYVLAFSAPEAYRLARRLELRRPEWRPLANERELHGQLFPLVLEAHDWREGGRRYGAVELLEDGLDATRARRLELPDDRQLSPAAWSLAFTTAAAGLYARGALSSDELGLLARLADTAARW